MTTRQNVLSRPVLPANLDCSAHWLAGEGAGSWFTIEAVNDERLVMNRYSPEGRLECTGEFLLSARLDLTRDYAVTYPSHCQILSLMQDGREFKLERIVDG